MTDAPGQISALLREAGETYYAGRILRHFRPSGG
jgi:hypothetical protein